MADVESQEGLKHRICVVEDVAVLGRISRRVETEYTLKTLSRVISITRM
jgi:hypothetical protein